MSRLKKFACIIIALFFAYLLSCCVRKIFLIYLLSIVSSQVRAVITKRGGMNGIRTLGRLFRIMDDNGSGTLTYEEVHYGLKDMGLRGEDALSKKVCGVRFHF